MNDIDRAQERLDRAHAALEICSRRGCRRPAVYHGICEDCYVDGLAEPADTDDMILQVQGPDVVSCWRV